MQKLSRTAITVAFITFLAGCLAFWTRGSAVAVAAPERNRPSDTELAMRISRDFPERRTSSYETSRLLAYLSGQLEIGGWFAELQPYSVLAKVESPEDRSTVFVSAEGQNLVALGNPDPASLDYLLIAPYDNMFADVAGTPRQSSSTAASVSTALELAGSVDRTAGVSLGIAFVGGHYQYGAGTRALFESMKARNIAVKCAIILGDFQAPANIPIVAGPGVPASLVESVVSAMRESELTAYISTSWNLGFLNKNTAGQSPEALSPVRFTGEQDILSDLGIPVMTIGLPQSGPTTRLGAAATRDEDLGAHIRGIATALTLSLSTPPGEDSGSLAGMRVVRLLERTYLIPDTLVMASGLVLAAVFATISLFRLPKDASSLALLAGTTLASTTSMLLHFLFTNRENTRYASSVYPARGLALFFIVFVTLLSVAFLRLLSIRSRIHHIHGRFHTEAEPVARKATWGSAWSLAILAALTFGASLTRSEMLPSLLISGAAHAVGTLTLRLSSRVGKPSGLALWAARIMYTVPLIAVFWAGNPLSSGPQAIYRTSWTGLNQGSLVSALSLAAVAASILSTMEFPKPAPVRAMLPLTLCELGLVALLVILGFTLPASMGPGVPTWVVLSEEFGSASKISVGSPATVKEVSIAGTPSGMPERLEAKASSKSYLLTDRITMDWAQVALRQSKAVREGSRSTSRMTANTEISELPDAVVASIAEFGNRASGFEVSGLNSMFPMKASEAPFEEPVLVSAGHSVSFIWWRSAAMPASFQFDLEHVSTSRIGTSLKAYYFDRSYLRIKPTTEGIRYYQVTSAVSE